MEDKDWIPKGTTGVCLYNDSFTHMALFFSQKYF